MRRASIHDPSAARNGRRSWSGVNGRVGVNVHLSDSVLARISQRAHSAGADPASTARELESAPGIGGADAGRRLEAGLIESDPARPRLSRLRAAIRRRFRPATRRGSRPAPRCPCRTEDPAQRLRTVGMHLYRPLESTARQLAVQTAAPGRTADPVRQHADDSSHMGMKVLDRNISTIGPARLCAAIWIHDSG